MIYSDRVLDATTYADFGTFASNQTGLADILLSSTLYVRLEQSE
jgi:hypothetical protein